MNVLLVGGGGREHALAWAIARSSRLGTLRIAPGNAGMSGLGECLKIAAEDVDALARHAIEQRYDLVVVGPEAPLVGGLADRLREAGIPVFGPSAAAAEIEGSKVFAKQFLERHGIPTAGCRIFEEVEAAVTYLDQAETRYPLVVKADGLAAGKGVILADDAATACEAARGMLDGSSFGAAGRRILVEEMLYGREASFFVLSDGKSFVELATCQDYKRALDGDAGPNTGGMGTYSPSVYLDDALRRDIVDRIVRPTIDGMAAEGRPYRGVLYVGVMLTDDGPQVLEYNARFGDPETQVLLPRLDGDWLELLHACAVGDLGGHEPAWKPEAAVCVVMASGGYPGSYGKGAAIRGLDAFARTDDVVVFHAGTAGGKPGEVLTSGGRVLGVTALGADLDAARRRAYEAVTAIGWDGEQHRSDIAQDAVERLGQMAAQSRDGAEETR